MIWLVNENQRKNEMTIISTQTDDELRRTVEDPNTNCWDRQTATSELSSRAALINRRGRQIGYVIEFVRHGRSVATSRNHREGTSEDGMSVYLLDGEEVIYVGWWFDISSRPAYRGRGMIEGFGSDCEPVVQVIGKCRRAREFDR